MKQITLGTTGITTMQNAFGALPVQRADKDTAIEILNKAYDGGMTFFDTARAYSDSEEKIGLTFGDRWDELRDKIYIASKTMARTPEKFWEDLETSLKMLKRDHIDIYQFHCVDQAYAPNDGTGMYECMIKAKEMGKIKHIGITTHKIQVAFDIVNSGLYETIQYPFSYLASDREKELVKAAQDNNMGFIAMKGLAGGLITNSKAAMAFMTIYNVLPIWGIQRIKELDEWLAFFDNTPSMDDEINDFIEGEKNALMGEFCRGCGYCAPCPQGIMIHQCARISLMVRRAPSDGWLNENWQNEVKKIENCTGCRACTKKCPYSLDIPNLLKRNYEDYQSILSGKASVNSSWK